jgi:hypothetical protein
MTFNLSDDLRQAVQTEGTPLRLIDAATGEIYLLCRESEQDALSDSYRAQMESAMQAGWSDPAMDDYNDYDSHHKQ